MIDGCGFLWPKVGSCWQKPKRSQRTLQTKVLLDSARSLEMPMLRRIIEPANEILFLAVGIILAVCFAFCCHFLRNELFGDDGPTAVRLVYSNSIGVLRAIKTYTQS